jgi:hypothetical protein
MDLGPILAGEGREQGPELALVLLSPGKKQRCMSSLNTPGGIPAERCIYNIFNTNLRTNSRLQNDQRSPRPEHTAPFKRTS